MEQEDRLPQTSFEVSSWTLFAHIGATGKENISTLGQEVTGRLSGNYFIHLFLRISLSHGKVKSKQDFQRQPDKSSNQKLIEPL